MLTWPNLLSVLRLPLIFLLFQDNPFYRAAAIFLAMVTDVLDGYLARKFNQESRFGTWIDPITDKIFVFAALYLFYHEGKLLIWQGVALMGRDLAVFSFGIYLVTKDVLQQYQVKAIFWGKVTTALQFFVLFALIFYGRLPDYVYFPFIVFSILAFYELYKSSPQKAH